MPLLDKVDAIKNIPNHTTKKNYKVSMVQLTTLETCGNIDLVF